MRRFVESDRKNIDAVTMSPGHMSPVKIGTWMSEALQFFTGFVVTGDMVTPFNLRSVTKEEQNVF